MGQFTVRNFDDAAKKTLQARAALKGRSMEEEVRVILLNTIARDGAAPLRRLGDLIAAQSALYQVTEADIEELNANIAELRQQPRREFTFEGDA